MTRTPVLSVWCAICTAPITGIPSRQPLGRNDALVAVCANCDNDTPRASCSTRGYVSPGGVIGAGAAVRKLEAELGVLKRRGGNETAVARTPGFVLVRVPIRDADGKPRDQAQARATLAHQPWAAELRYLSTSGFGKGFGFHLFERPGARAAEQGDQLAELEQHRVTP